MHDALDNLLKQPLNELLNPLFFQRVKKELRELMARETHLEETNKQLSQQVESLSLQVALDARTVMKSDVASTVGMLPTAMSSQTEGGKRKKT